jgi:hypothetical protein
MVAEQGFQKVTLRIVTRSAKRKSRANWHVKSIFVNNETIDCF